MKKFVKTQEINNLLMGKTKYILKLRGKFVKPLKIKQTFDLTEKIEVAGKTRQNAENKQTFVLTFDF